MRPHLQDGDSPDADEAAREIANFEQLLPTIRRIASQKLHGMDKLTRETFVDDVAAHVWLRLQEGKFDGVNFQAWRRQRTVAPSTELTRRSVKFSWPSFSHQ